MPHRALEIDEILREVAARVVNTHRPAAVSLACCAKSFEEPVLRALWETQKKLTTLIKTLPPDCWEVRSPSTGKKEIALRRILSEDERTRVRRYASWMKIIRPSFVVGISNEVFNQLAPATSGGPVCPRLQHLSWSSAYGWENSRQFFPPHLVSVSFWRSVNDLKADLGLDSAISSLPTTHLETLTLVGNNPYTTFIHPALSRVVRRLNTCFKHIDADSSISDAAWGHLASLPKLESLHLFNTPTIEVLKSVSQEHTFPVLESMVLELWGQYQNFPVLFSLLKPSPLKFVSVSGSHRVQHAGIPSEVTIAILKAELHRSLKALAFNGFYPADLAFVSHLGPFSSLETLRFDTRCRMFWQCVFPLTDSDIEQLASGLPQLVVLHLGHKCLNCRTNTTIKSMISLSTHCRLLDTLYLPCDLTNISEDVKMESGEPDPRLETRSSCALRVLAFDWMIRSESVEASGIMESALCHLFPQLQST